MKNKKILKSNCYFCVSIRSTRNILDSSVSIKIVKCCPFCKFLAMASSWQIQKRVSSVLILDFLCECVRYARIDASAGVQKFI